MISLERTVGAQPVTGLTRRRVKEILAGIDSAGGRVHCAAVLKKIADVAWDHELITSNPAIRLELEKSRRRDQVWTEEDITVFLAACEGEHLGHAVALAVTLLLHTAQRPGDVRRMTWNQYDGKTIRLRQQKTGTPLAVPCTEELRAALDAARAKASGVTIVAKPDGQPITDALWDKVFNPIRTKAGLDHLQARDLRRTAIVRLAMAGCSAPEIASVSGHSLESTERILEVYLPRTASMAQSAITKLEEYRK
jgi:integrase